MKAACHPGDGTLWPTRPAALWPVFFSVVHHISQLSKTGGYGKYAEEETLHHRKGSEILGENFKAVNMNALGFLPC